MIGALWTGISGLSSQQQALDNESNNIANVNTVGYKASRISFADQMYQDRIGKGSKILDSEKLYTQGNLKLTGVNYDMALSGDGFFTVVNTRSSGASETLYTRAGNFRMGDNGTLQDAAGNEVQGWMMSPIDSQNDVTSTNPNVSVFNNNYNKLLGSKIIRHGTYVETITAKATDYTATAKSDATSIFSGDGTKTKSAKISDVEEAIKDYTFWLQKLKDEPDASSATSIAQISQIDFKSGNESIISKDGDQIYVYINGNKISQNFLLTTANQDFREKLWESIDQTLEPAANGLVDPNPPFPTTLNEAQIAAYDKAASKIATYKALVDKISQIPGLVATMAKSDVFDSNATFVDSTKLGDMLRGTMQIRSLIPGKEFTISEVAEVSGNTTIQGNFQTSAFAQKGSGIAALETSRDALAKLMTGKQQDVYTPSDLKLDPDTAKVFSYGITIYDKEIGKVIPVPNDGNNPISMQKLIIPNAKEVDDIALAINNDPDLSKYVEARVVNGNLVINTLNSNFDVEFTGNIKQLPSFLVDLNEDDVDNSRYTFNVNINGTPRSFEVPAEVTTNADALRDYLAGIPTLSSYNLAVNDLDSTNGKFTIYSTDESAILTGSDVHIGDNPSLQNIPVVGSKTPYPPSTDPTPIYEGYAYTFSLNDDHRASRFVLKVGGVEVATYSTDGKPNMSSLAENLDDDLVFPSYSVENLGDNILIIKPYGVDFELVVEDIDNDETYNSSTSIVRPIDVNANYSGRKGAGAEFIEIVNKVDQAASKGSLQLRLDTLGISDSAFGEFSVDSTGLITMKQDGAEFAIGQVAIAVFNNNRGLNPMGDNLLSKTNESGDPIYNLNNNKTAKVEGKTLELSTADLSESLVNLMVFQRAFEANAKSITTSDELLNTLINLKR